MKYFLLNVLSLSSLLAIGQSLPNENFQNQQSVPCPADTTQMVFGFLEWEAYQTFSDEWDGPIDTNICIFIGQNAGHATIDFSEVDTSRKVFLRSVMDSANYPVLMPHNKFHMADILTIAPDMVLDTTSNCPNAICSGAITVVEIPDSTGSGTAYREHRGALTQDWISSANYKTCFASEKFMDQRVVEHILIFKVESFGTIDQLLVGSAGFVLWGAPAALINDSTIEQYRTGQFEYEILPLFSEAIVTYQDSTYPSPDSISFVEVRPDPNVSTQETISISAWGIIFELFTDFRGATVLGDTIRHQIDFTNWGIMCIPDPAELVFNNGDRFTYAGGNVEMAGPHACFQFGRKGTLAVADNATYRFGAPGRGILALRTGAEVEIGRNAELVICNKLYLQEYWEETQSQNIEMTLGQGSRLTFAPGACIDNSNSIGQNMKLVVYLDGGSVDLSGLCLSDRDKVVVKRLPKDNESTLRLFGNAVSTSLDLELLSRQETNAQLNIYSSTGAFISSTVVLLTKGKNRTTIDLIDMADGLYIVEAIHAGKRETARFVKVD